MERFKAMVRDDMARILPFLGERPNTQKLMAERYGVQLNQQEEVNCSGDS